MHNFPRHMPGFGRMLSWESMVVATVLVCGGALLMAWLLILPKLRRRRRGGRLHQKPSLDFSLTGLVYCSMMLFMGLAAINSQANLLFGVFGLMVGILLISGVVSRMVMRRLKVRRALPDHGCVGRPMNFVYQISNGKKFWPSLSVSVAELDSIDGFARQPQAYMLHAAPGTIASVPAEIVPMRRGLHLLDRFQISSSFPFGFFKRAIIDQQRDVVLVYPPLGQVDRKVLTLCRAAERAGSSIRPQKGGNDEFYGVKEFRPGDNPRRIYWRRSAHTAATGTLVAKEMTRVAPPRLMLLVDTFLPMPPARDAGTMGDGDAETREAITPAAIKPAAIEKTIAMAASLAAAALDQDLSVGLLAWSNGWKTIEPSRGKRHRNDVLSILARLPVNHSRDATQLLQEARGLLRSASTAVLLSPAAHPAPRDGMLALSPASPETAAWFRFEPQVDFSRCAPEETRSG